VAVGLFAQWHLLRFMDKVGRYMLGADAGLVERYGGAGGRSQRMREQRRSFRRDLLPLVVRTYFPWYTPENIPFTPAMKELADRYTDMATGR
jgi:hypothetical protein